VTGNTEFIIGAGVAAKHLSGCGKKDPFRGKGMMRSTETPASSIILTAHQFCVTSGRSTKANATGMDNHVCPVDRHWLTQIWWAVRWNR